jgi:hypothetical protein
MFEFIGKIVPAGTEKNTFDESLLFQSGLIESIVVNTLSG